MALSIFSLLLVFVYGCGGNSPEYYVRPEVDVAGIKRVAVFPFESLTNDMNAGEKIRRMVITELLSRGIDVIEPGEVTSHLKDMKIKNLGSISSRDIKNTGKTLGVDTVMTGSVEAYNISRGVSVSYPEVSINLMLLNTSNGEIIWSVWNTSGGADFWTRHFGTEGISLSEAAGKVVRKSIDTLFSGPSPVATARRQYRDK
ncbi:MAG: hypothetical protein VST72_02755 [Nitrospirota bacterium]|nr:hypothetical protein [Nitrospirota bacterium]